VTIGEVAVVRKIEITGERLSLEADLQTRQPVRGDGGPGSAWILNLGADMTPVDRIEVNIADEAFVRNYRLEMSGPEETSPRFNRIASGSWRRRAGEGSQPMVAQFRETRAARLRLVVTDNRNPPLQVERVMYSAPARQVVFAAPEKGTSLRLYYGHEKAGRAEYDFAGNLPERLEPEPARATLAPRSDNPVFVPEPLPLTERWPWLTYAVLTAVTVVLAGLLVSLSRTAIRAHDASLDDEAAPQPVASADSDST
jgi:hypothetical protein